VASVLVAVADSPQTAEAPPPSISSTSRSVCALLLPLFTVFGFGACFRACACDCEIRCYGLDWAASLVMGIVRVELLRGLAAR
jgi:hypothetical protein